MLSPARSRHQCRASSGGSAPAQTGRRSTPKSSPSRCAPSRLATLLWRDESCIRWFFCVCCLLWFFVEMGAHFLLGLVVLQEGRDWDSIRNHAVQQLMMRGRCCVAAGGAADRLGAAGDPAAQLRRRGRGRSARRGDIEQASCVVAAGRQLRSTQCPPRHKAPRAAASPLSSFIVNGGRGGRRRRPGAGVVVVPSQ